MSTTVEERVEDGAERATQAPLIDVDVHERMKEKEQLLPYLDPLWQRYIRDYAGLFPGVQAPSEWPYAAPHPGPTRLEWAASDDAGGGRELHNLQRHLLEGEKVTTAILNGAFYPSSLVGNYEFAGALASAYNDWQIEEWLEKEPRLRGSIHIVAHDPAAAVREIDRAGEHPQMVQVHLPLATDRQYGDPFYRPIFEAAVRNGLALCFHHDRRTKTVLGYPRYYVEWHSMAAPQAAMNQILSLILNGTFDKFPDLRTVFLEAGVAWVPWFMWRVDQQYRELRVEVPWVKRLPSEHMRDCVRVATQPMGDIPTSTFVDLVEQVQAERIYVFSTDYPHYDADSADIVLPGSVPEELRERIRYKNALDTYPRLARLAA